MLTEQIVERADLYANGGNRKNWFWNKYTLKKNKVKLFKKIRFTFLKFIFAESGDFFAFVGSWAFLCIINRLGGNYFFADFLVKMGTNRVCLVPRLI